MSMIIKANDRNCPIRGVAFNFDDMTDKADQYLDQIRAEAGRILAAAEEEAGAIRRRAEVEGRRAGEHSFEQTVEKQLAGQLATLMPALKRTIQDIQHAKQAWLAHWEKSAVHLAAAIAKRIVRRELSETPEITLALVREALELAAGSSQLRIHLSPTDHETLGSQVDNLVRKLSTLESTQLVADPEITAGGCRVETRFGVIDQQIEAQLARIEEELT